MPQGLSFGEWINTHRALLPRPVKTGLIAGFLFLLGLGTGLWLTHTHPTVTVVPGRPIAVAIDDGRIVRDPAFIATLVTELNGLSPYAADAATSCVLPAGVRQYDLRFEYDDGDRLTVTVHAACGGSTVGASYAPGIVARGTNTLVNDLENWPLAP